MPLPIYVIHARSLPERVAHLTNELRKAGLSAHWITDFDVADLTTEIENRWFNPDSLLSKGQKSCALKHITAMQRISESKAEYALVLEDDVMLVDDFILKLRRALDEATEWQRPFALNLGIGTNFYTSAAQLVPGKMLYTGLQNRNAEAYVIGATEAGLRLKWITEHRLSDPIDIAYSAADTAMNIQILWTEPPLAEQGSLTGKFQSSLDPKNRHRYLLRLQFPVQKFRRKYMKRWVHAVTSRFSLNQLWRTSTLD